MSEKWIGEFLQIIMNHDATTDEISRAFELKSQNLPQMLYRYRPPKDRSIKELEHDSVWASQPAGQNDPLDSIWQVSMLEVFKATMRARFPKIAQNSGIMDQLTEDQMQVCASSDDPMAALQEARIESSAPDEMANLVKMFDVLRTFVSKEVEEMEQALRQIPHHHLRICCFSTDYQSTSMWDRYSGERQGLCIAYDFSSLPPSPRNELWRRWVYPVIYRDTPFDLTPFLLANIKQPTPAPLLPMLASIHKTADWSNEKEWRLVMPPETTPTAKLEYLCKPSSVYMGDRMEPDMEQRVEAIARRRGITVFKMEVSQSERRLIARPR